MKKVSSLLIGVILAGASYAQNDTIPAGQKSQPNPLKKDTVPLLRSDTTPPLRRDTVNWNKDSLKHKEWNDTLGKTNKQGWKDSSAIGSKPGTLKDTSGVSMDDKNKWKENSNSATNKNEADTTPVVKTKKIIKDRVMMKDGEMVIIKKGVETKMEKNITLADGNVVMTNGTIKMTDGNSVKLKEGEYVAIEPKKDKSK